MIMPMTLFELEF